MATPGTTRQRVTLRGALYRSLLERLALRFPSAARFAARVILRRPPTSRVRRVSVRYIARTVFDAANRADYEAAFALLSPDYEVVTPPELRSLGFDSTYRGRAGRLRFQLRWVDELDDFQQGDVEVVDYGERLLMLARMRGTGLSSGATFDSEIAYLLTIIDGELVREHSFRSHEEGLQAAGRPT